MINTTTYLLTYLLLTYLRLLEQIRHLRVQLADIGKHCEINMRLSAEIRSKCSACTLHSACICVWLGWDDSVWDELPVQTDVSMTSTHHPSYNLLSSSGPFSEQWAASFASVHDRPLVPPPRSSWLILYASQNVDRQVFLGLPFLFLPSTGIQSIALWAGRSGGRVPQTGISSLLRCLATASVRFVSICLCLLPCPS